MYIYAIPKVIQGQNSASDSINLSVCISLNLDPFSRSMIKPREETDQEYIYMTGKMVMSDSPQRRQ